MPRNICFDGALGVLHSLVDSFSRLLRGKAEECLGNQWRVGTSGAVSRHPSSGDGRPHVLLSGLAPEGGRSCCRGGDYWHGESTVQGGENISWWMEVRDANSAVAHSSRTRSSQYFLTLAKEMGITSTCSSLNRPHLHRLCAALHGNRVTPAVFVRFGPSCTASHPGYKRQQ